MQQRTLAYTTSLEVAVDAFSTTAGCFVKGDLGATGPSALLLPNREPVSQLIGGQKILCLDQLQRARWRPRQRILAQLGRKSPARKLPPVCQGLALNTGFHKSPFSTSSEIHAFHSFHLGQLRPFSPRRAAG